MNIPLLIVTLVAAALMVVCLILAHEISELKKRAGEHDEVLSEVRSMLNI